MAVEPNLEIQLLFFDVVLAFQELARFRFCMFDIIDIPGFYHNLI